MSLFFITAQKVRGSSESAQQVIIRNPSGTEIVSDLRRDINIPSNAGKTRINQAFGNGLYKVYTTYAWGFRGWLTSVLPTLEIPQLVDADGFKKRDLSALQ